VTTDQGRPDLEIRSLNQLVFIEAKVESGIGDGQLQRYRAELSSRCPRSRLVVLTRYAADLPVKECDPADIFIRWYEVAEFINRLSLSHPTSKYLANQFLEFLKERGMTIERIGWELTSGVRSLMSLIDMLAKAAEALGLKKGRTAFAEYDPWIGFFLANKRYWAGVTLLTANQVYFNTYTLKVDKAKAESFGLASGLFDSNAPNETLGPTRWQRILDLESEDSHFFARTKESQLRYLEQFLRDFVDTATKIEAK
jgi:hypothetical protein